MIIYDLIFVIMAIRLILISYQLIFIDLIFS